VVDLVGVKTFKVRLYPTANQRGSLEGQLRSCARLYNALLEQRRIAWKSHRLTLSEYDQCEQIPDVVQHLPEYQAVYSQVLRDVCTRVDLAYQAFFRRCRSGETPGYPRFRAASRYDSLTYRQPGNGSVRVQTNHVTLSKLCTNLRFIPKPAIRGRVRIVTVRRQADRWFLCVTCDQVPPTIVAGSNEVGLDLGLTTLAVLSDGSTVENPRYAKRASAKLAAAQRRVARSQKGSHRRRKLILLLQKHHLKVVDQRRYAFHKAARRIVEANRFIAVERLAPSVMSRTPLPGFAKSFHDASWALFLSILRRKAEDAGARVVEVDPRGTTQECSGCGTVVPKGLAVRVHTCPHCGLVLGRDLNAAHNILRRARLEPSLMTPLGVA